MKIDCNVAKNYFKEKNRMTKNCEISCGDCPLCINNNKTNLLCKKLENTYPEKAIGIVKAWSDEHQAETRKEHFLKMFPNASIWKGRPFLCVRNLNKKVSCENECEKCWNEPYTEGEF